MKESGISTIYWAILITIACIYAATFLFTPENQYIDYYLHYINNANEPLFDWFVIAMGGISVNDIILLFIITVITIYAFALNEKDDEHNTNIKLKHVLHGILLTAVSMRLIFHALFLYNGCSCDEYQLFKTRINAIGNQSVKATVDNITLTKKVSKEDVEKASVGDSIYLYAGKGSMDYYTLGKEYKIMFSGKKYETMPSDKKSKDNAYISRQANGINKRWNKKARMEYDQSARAEMKKYNALLDSIDKYKYLSKNALEYSQRLTAIDRVDYFKAKLDSVEDKKLLERVTRERKAKKIRQEEENVKKAIEAKETTPARYIGRIPLASEINECFVSTLRKDNPSGYCAVRFKINKNGHVSDLSMAQELDPKSNELLTEYVKNKRFTPKLINGKPVEAYYRITICISRGYVGSAYFFEVE